MTGAKLEQNLRSASDGMVFRGHTARASSLPTRQRTRTIRGAFEAYARGARTCTSASLAMTRLGQRGSIGASAVPCRGWPPGDVEGGDGGRSDSQGCGNAGGVGGDSGGDLRTRETTRSSSGGGHRMGQAGAGGSTSGTRQREGMGSRHRRAP